MAKLSFRYAVMNSGKTLTLLSIAHNYEEQGHKVRVLKPAVDDRDGLNVIASRMGLRREAELILPGSDMFDVLGAGNPKDVACVLIDEAQFLSLEQVQQLHRWVHAYDVPAICFGIRTDFRGLPFPGSSALMGISDSMEEVPSRAVCSCGKKATFNIRLDQEGNRVREGSQVLIGGNDRYKSICGRCFNS